MVVNIILELRHCLVERVDAAYETQLCVVKQRIFAHLMVEIVFISRQIGVSGEFLLMHLHVALRKII